MGKLVCLDCKTEYSINEPIWRCRCGGLLSIDSQPQFPLDKIAQRKPTLWRYREAIPVSDNGGIVSFDEGFTPLVEITMAGKKVHLKHDYMFPSGSYKDRGASVMISKIKELGIKKVVEDSSGNTGCAVAAYCARAGIECDIYVPESTSPGKLAQIRHYGANLKLVPGSREETARAVMKAAQTEYYASHSWNPFFFHGTKTFAFEVCEQLGWKAPDVVVVPVGSGAHILGSYIGFKELKTAGIIEKMPRLIGIQAVNCAPIYQAHIDGLETHAEVEKIHTIAEGIAIAQPVRSRQILAGVKETKGGFIAVDEDEIKEALRYTGRLGMFIEPTSAATIAGLLRYLEQSENSETVVSVLTGHGLKSTDKILEILMMEM